MGSFMSLKSARGWTFLSHCEQLNGLSPVWVLPCLFKWLEIEYLLSHWEQLNGLSPLWVLSCLFKLADVDDWEQLNGLSPLWVLSYACSKSWEISRISSRVLSSKLKIELTYYIGISNVLFLIRTQTYWTSPMPSHWIPFYSYIHSYIHGFLVLSIPSESDCLLIFCLSHIGTIPVSKFSL